MAKIKIKVVPRAGRRQIVLDKNGTIKCYLTSAPEDGKANREVVQMIADKLGIGRRDIEIEQGLTSQVKVLDIVGYESEDAIKKGLGLCIQENLFDENR